MIIGISVALIPAFAEKHCYILIEYTYGVTYGVLFMGIYYLGSFN